jgi:hypothetical protein
MFIAGKTSVQNVQDVQWALYVPVTRPGSSKSTYANLWIDYVSY